MHQKSFGAGLRLDSLWGAPSALPDSLAGLKGSRKEGKGKGTEVRKIEMDGERTKGRGGKGTRRACGRGGPRSDL